MECLYGQINLHELVRIYSGNQVEAGNYANVLTAMMLGLTLGVEWVVPRYHGDPRAALTQAPDLVVLDAAVHRRDTHRPGAVIHHRLLGGRATATWK